MSLFILFLFLLQVNNTFLVSASTHEMNRKRKTYMIVNSSSPSSINKPINLYGKEMIAKGKVKWKPKSRSLGMNLIC